MHPTSIYRSLAAFNSIIGLLSASGVVTLGVAIRRNTPEAVSFFRWGILIILAMVACGLIWTALSFFRAPNSKNAQLLAANTSVLLWLGINALLQSTGLTVSLGPLAPVIISIVIAYLIYRFVLKPMALRVA
jgi:hypothetical protein